MKNTPPTLTTFTACNGTTVTTLPFGAVFHRDGKPVTICKAMAELFGKRDDNVTRDIIRLIKADPSCALNFEETWELTAMPRGGYRKSRVYSINRAVLPFS